MKTFIVTTLVLTAFASIAAQAQSAKNPWSEYITASGHGSNEPAARSFAQMDFNSKAMMVESRCRNTGGAPTTMSYNPFCQEAAPDFYRCDINGNVNCNYY